MNTLITIGCTGCKKAYLNVPLAEALRRYWEAHSEEAEAEVRIFDFTDAFDVYDAWPANGSATSALTAKNPVQP